MMLIKLFSKTIMRNEIKHVTPAPIRIGVIALSRVLDDPRVRRQCEVLQNNGFQVFAIGEDDERSERVNWTVAKRPSHPAEVRPVYSRLKSALQAFLGRSLQQFLRRSIWVARVQWCRLQPQYAGKVFWSWKSTIDNLYEKAKPLRCDIWLANDWITLPIAARLATENGGIYVYDTHEFALEEYQERLIWRFFQKPFVAGIEKTFIGGAKLVTAVSSGIADRLTEIYRLPRAALTVRNTPRYVEVPFRPTPPVIRVLYHGIVTPGRGLEAAIDSVPKWSADRQLYIRGPGSDGYLASIRKRIEEAGLQSRVFVIPPVRMTELVVAASEFDVGFFALPGHSLHNQYALPNKFFEYAMAGLALCVSRLPEMTSILSKYEFGSTFAAMTPELIAAAVNELSREKIDRYKRNSLLAAKELCWEAESLNLVSALRMLVAAKA
jgi:glycosyltransferase involved in cell wall biosynthesis